MTLPPARAAAVSAGETLLAVALALLAVRWWHRGMIAAEVVGGAELFQVDGRWWAAAVLGVTVAGLLLIDALRRIGSGVASAGPPVGEQP